MKKLWAAVCEKFAKMTSKRKIKKQKIPKKSMASSIKQSKKPPFISVEELIKAADEGHWVLERTVTLGGSNFSLIPTLPETPKIINPAVEVFSTTQPDNQPIKN